MFEQRRVQTELRDAILGWYDSHGRSLPFRRTRDPYAILVSEVMAQQTQIERVGPRWDAFLATFPSIATLAAATPGDVLRSWAGLGYNRRALNLWRCAQVVVGHYAGRLPSTVEELTRLPGIGPYTARAVGAIAFGLPVGAVDTNVRRVLGRVTGVAERELQALADAIVPPDRPADWTHAVMDVGATFCRSGRPRCSECPARPWCRFAADGKAAAGPRRAQPPERKPVAFPTTRRWLRGRILERLRSADEWVVFDRPIGAHDHGAVLAALEAMNREGLVEIQCGVPHHPLRARLPRS